MSRAGTYKIIGKTIVVFVRNRHFVHLFSEPPSAKLREYLEQHEDPLQAYVALAEHAAKNPATISRGRATFADKWTQLFGLATTPPDIIPCNEISGTIIVNTSKRDFCYQLNQQEAFVPYLMKAFWRKEDPAAALAFLAEFAVLQHDLAVCSPGKEARIKAPLAKTKEPK